MSRSKHIEQRQSRHVPLPEAATISLAIEGIRDPIILDRMREHEDMAGNIKLPTGRTRVYQGEGLRVIVTMSEHSRFGRLLHASMSMANGKLPPWVFMIALKRAIFPPDVAAMLPMPEESAYTNIGEVLHIIQVPGPWGHL